MPVLASPRRARRAAGVARLLSAAATVCLAAATSAQPAPLPRNGPSLDRAVTIAARACSFQEAIELLTRELGVQFVADGLPMIKSAQIGGTGACRGILDSFCEAFDYRWTSPKPGIVLLHKRFTDRDDRPQFLLPELAQMAREMLRVLPDVVPDDRAWEGSIRDLLRSITPDQSDALVAGARIPLTKLRPEQQDLARRTIDQRVYGVVLKGVTDLVPRLATLPRAGFQYRVWSGQPPRGVPQTRTTLWLTGDTPSGQQMEIHVGNGLLKSPAELAAAAPSDAQATAPAQGQAKARRPASGKARAATDDEAALDTPLHLRLGYVTVEDLLGEVAGQTGLRVLPPSVSADRRMFVWLDAVPARRVLSVVCSLQDWEWKQVRAHVYAVVRPSAVRSGDRQAICAAMRRAVPMDLRGYLHYRGPDYVMKDPRDPDEGGQQRAELSGERLAQTLLPRLARGDKVGYADLTEAERGDLYPVILVDALDGIRELASGWPSVANVCFENAMVWVKPNQGFLFGTKMDGFGVGLREAPWLPKTEPKVHVIRSGETYPPR